MFSTTLSYFDSAAGVNPIISKLPYSLQEKWISRAIDYKRKHSVPFPPFSVFAKFVHEQSRIRNDPSFFYDTTTSNNPSTVSNTSQKKTSVSTRKTSVEVKCPIHKMNHSLDDCRVFKGKSFAERRKVLSDNKMCFRCLSVEHLARECKTEIKCSVCENKFHCTAMHVGPATQGESRRPANGIGWENNWPQAQRCDYQPKQEVVNRCTEIGQDIKSCAKIVLLNVFTDQNQDNMVRCYGIIDEQSNKTLAKPELFDLLGIEGDEFDYCLNSCAGPTNTSGRKAINCNVMSLDSAVCYKLPTMIECADIPCNKHEICTSENAKDFPHLSSIIDKLPQPDEHAQILLLLGRDVIDVHPVLDQVVGPPGAPFAQRLSLGWVVVGELCVGNFHANNRINVFKTHLLSNGRPSLFKPCDSVHAVVENCYSYDPVFVRKVDDNQRSLSVDDRNFLHIMDENMKRDESGHWVAPLPFRQSRERLPNNCAMSLRRARTLHSSLSRNPVKQKQLLEFMSKIIDKGHAEIAPILSKGEECWYLPVFGVTHPRKPDQVRGVFDSSAQYQGVSLNSVLLSGPDLTNSLLGVLMRFRNEQVPVIADIEQMFYSFRVDVKHRNLLRFWWYKNNNPELDLIEYRMCVHVFGNSPSPAVASYGLRKSVVDSDADVRDYVSGDFYVDDGVTSKPTSDEVISLIKRTQNDLAACGLRLHKIASCNLDVIKAFDVDDLAKDIRCLEFDKEALPVQRSLGVAWSLSLDCFTFKVDPLSRPLTRRGILSTVNSLFDPMGFVAPVTIVSKFILRELMSIETNWDEPVPQDIESKFTSWRDSLQALSKIHIPRCYFKVCLANFVEISLHVFSDASEKAISAVAYVVGISPKFNQVSFVLGKSKVAPLSGHTIPRLELCAAVLGVEIADVVLRNIGIPLSVTKFYSDSRVVLGYINNQSRRFHTYVSNRVQRIRHSSSPQQWGYICSSENPADVGSRGLDPEQLPNSLWFTGPSRLIEHVVNIPEFFPMISPENDSEVRPEVKVLATDICLGYAPCNCSQKFVRFSYWEKLILGLSLLKHVVCSFRHKSCKGWHLGCGQYKSVEAKTHTELFVLQQVQLEVYHEELECLGNQKPVPKHSSLYVLDPFVDVDGLLKVGGRLRRSSLSSREKHPILLPGKHHVSKLLAYSCHELVQHQGRLFTEGSIRSAGYWITGGKRLIASLIFNCVKCKILRGRFETQKMSDLPFDRVEMVPPFSYVGVDVFGPWEVVSRRTRGGQACSKRWATMFTCLSIRAVHIEVIDEMTSSAFINALHRFIAIRGSVNLFRSDRGTNFVGSTDSLKIDTINVEDEKTKKFLYNSNCVWLFNPPHSSHFGGSWERMIGISRRILESLLGNVKNLTHDVLVTLMAEVSVIINTRPLVPVSSDCENPEVLSPSVLLTQKFLKNDQPVGDMDVKLMYKDQWKRVQLLADQFWVKWKQEYLQTLQKRRFWNSDQNPIEIGDVVLLKDKDVSRNCWPMGLISKVFPSADSRIRKVEVVVFKDRKRLSYTRPIVDMVLLVKGNTSQ